METFKTRGKKKKPFFFVKNPQGGGGWFPPPNDKKPEGNKGGIWGKPRNPPERLPPPLPPLFFPFGNSFPLGGWVFCGVGVGPPPKWPPTPVPDQPLLKFGWGGWGKPEIFCPPHPPPGFLILIFRLTGKTRNKTPPSKPCPLIKTLRLICGGR